ncbi:MAG TPA: DinB family protein [Acidisarcina sp.]|nr:DinB family protein [Acidisarcina sp.]
MKIPYRFPAFAFCCLLLAPTAALCQAKPEMPPVGTKVSPSQAYGKLLSGFENVVVSAAEAMPEEKYNFAPTQGEFKGVRTFAQQVKHIAEANYHYWGSFSGSSEDGSSIEKLTTKADIVKALKDSFVVAQKAVDTMTPENAFEMTPKGTRAGMTSFGIAHFMDHYGQMVEYMRMNGIVPPASRSRMEGK